MRLSPEAKPTGSIAKETNPGIVLIVQPFRTPLPAPVESASIHVRPLMFVV